MKITLVSTLPSRFEVKDSLEPRLNPTPLALLWRDDVVPIKFNISIRPCPPWYRRLILHGSQSNFQRLVRVSYEYRNAQVEKIEASQENKQANVRALAISLYRQPTIY